MAGQMDCPAETVILQDKKCPTIGGENRLYAIAVKYPAGYKPEARFSSDINTVQNSYDQCDGLNKTWSACLS